MNILALMADAAFSAAKVVTVDVHEIERGDRLGSHTLDHVLYHGNDGDWLLVDHLGVIVGRRPMGARVQVVRGLPLPDDTPAHGIARPHLRLVK